MAVSNVIDLSQARKSLIRKRKRWEAAGRVEMIDRTETNLLTLEGDLAEALMIEDADIEHHARIAAAMDPLAGLKKNLGELRALQGRMKGILAEIEGDSHDSK